MYSTVDNTDVVSHVYGAFDGFIVLDTRAQYQLLDRVSLGAGVDNLTNSKYVLFHPFPGRTFFLDAKVKF